MKSDLAKLLLAAAIVVAGIGCGDPDLERVDESLEASVEQRRDEIFGGIAVADRTFPWAVSLHDTSATAAGNQFCSGSHIAPGWVLTAQHCFDSNMDGTISADEVSANQVWASLNRTRISDTSRGEVLQGAQLFLNFTNDLALLRLVRPSAAPIIQLARAAPAPGTIMTVAGWGLIDARTLPDNLQAGKFKVSTRSNALDLRYFGINGEEVCPADSGGPAFTQAGGLVQQVAVTTHTSSPACGSGPFSDAVGSRIDVALPWIRSIVQAQYAFVWADQPTATSYSPHASYSFNSEGGANFVTRSSTGSYQVEFGRMGQSQSDNIQVTSYGDSTRHCQVAYWVGMRAGTSLLAGVRCFNSSGAPSDAQFVVQFYRAGAGNPEQSAYLWANQSTAVSYVPLRSYNSRGGENTITRSGTGLYRARLPGFDTAGGNVQVTAYDTSSNYCKVVQWSTLNTVDVACFDAAGIPADTQWTLRYTDRHVSNNGQRGAYVWIHDATATTHTPSLGYQWNSQGTTLTARRSGTGTYQVNIPSIGATNSSVMVTAYGAGNAKCNVAVWGAAGTGTEVWVRCRNRAGAAVDSLFTLSYVTSIWPGPPAE